MSSRRESPAAWLLLGCGTGAEPLVSLTWVGISDRGRGFGISEPLKSHAQLVPRGPELTEVVDRSESRGLSWPSPPGVTLRHEHSGAPRSRRPFLSFGWSLCLLGPQSLVIRCPHKALGLRGVTVSVPYLAECPACPLAFSV